MNRRHFLQLLFAGLTAAIVPGEVWTAGQRTIVLPPACGWPARPRLAMLPITVRTCTIDRAVRSVRTENGFELAYVAGPALLEVDGLLAAELLDPCFRRDAPPFAIAEFPGAAFQLEKALLRVEDNRYRVFARQVLL